MKNFVQAALIAGASFAVAPAAQAAPVITITGASGTFGDDAVNCAAGSASPCSFDRTFTFVTPANFNLASATISSIMAGGNALTNIDFGSVTLNGVNFAINSTGDVEFRSLLSQALVAGGTNTLLVNGATGGDASFSGTLSFAASAAGAVPEPATWAMMLMGFGAMGYAMRRRRAAVRISYAA